MFVEFFGIPGAGKSTIASRLTDALLSANCESLTLNEAITICLGRSILGSVMISNSIVAVDSCNRILARLYKYIFSTAYRYSMIILEPNLFFKVHHLLLVRNLTWRHRCAEINAFFEVYVGYKFLRKRIYDNEIVILDEGLIHRAVNLFAWNLNGLDRNRVIDYFYNLPKLKLAILVYAPLEICMERVMLRGLPKRLNGRSQKNIDSFFRNNERITELASSYLDDAKRRKIQVDNVVPITSLSGGMINSLKEKVLEIHFRSNKE